MSTANDDQPPQQKYPHYHVEIPQRRVDFYRVMDDFQVQYAAAQHAIKKLMFLGRRGIKDQIQDATEARDSCTRLLEMLQENRAVVDPAGAASDSDIRGTRGAVLSASDTPGGDDFPPGRRPKFKGETPPTTPDPQTIPPNSTGSHVDMSDVDIDDDPDDPQ